ncbi:hypothetical protein SR870_13765 [Rhodopseudomonas palustris]|nr:hypothetical protein [Rhodopseudomonas palustris]WQG97780.1 hypothetical protein SR870_13765 [Rhodopseudomonas palustris]
MLDVEFDVAAVALVSADPRAGAVSFVADTHQSTLASVSAHLDK